MTTLRKKACPFITSPVMVSRTFGSVPYAASARVNVGPDELGRFGCDSVEQLRNDGRIRIVLEVGVRHRPQPIVLHSQRPAHHIARARIVEARKEHQRAVAHVGVRVRFDGLDQRRQRHRGICAARCPGCAGALGIVHRPELVDGRGQLRGRHAVARCGRRGGRDRRRCGSRRRARRRPGRLLGGRAGDSGQRQGGNDGRTHRRQSTTLSASCRYACWSRGKATGYTPV